MPFRLPRLFARFGRAREGVTAIEFAMIAPVFFAMLLGIFETAFTMLSGQLLETATTDASRLILTGQAQTQGMTRDTFKTKVCDMLPPFIDCAGKVFVDVQVINSFGTRITPPMKDGNLDPSGFKFMAGGPNDIVMVRVYYKWAGIIAPVVRNFGLDFGTEADGSMLQSATMVFKNEPYS